MRKKIIILIISLILAGGFFIFLKKVEDGAKLTFTKEHYRLWSTPNSFVMEHCVYNKCQTVDRVDINERTDVQLDFERGLLYFVRNGVLLARDFLNHSEQEIYTFLSGENSTTFSLSNSGNFMVLFTEKEGEKYYQVFDLSDNTNEKKQITFADKDDQVIGIVDDLGKVDFHVIGLVRSGMEGQQYYKYVMDDGKVQYKLTDNFGAYFSVAKQGNKILYLEDKSLRKLDLTSGLIEDRPIVDDFNYHLSGNGHFAIKQKCENNDFCRFILWDVDSNKDYLLFTNNDGMYIDGFWSNNDQYYIFSGAGGYRLVDINSRQTYWSWPGDDKHVGWSLIDVW